MRLIRAAMLAAAGLSALAAPAAHAATDVSVAVRPATPGTAAAPAPVALSLRATLTASSRGGLPPTLRTLSIGLPAGFATALEGTTACPRDDLALRGPQPAPRARRSAPDRPRSSTSRGSCASPPRPRS